MRFADALYGVAALAALFVLLLALENRFPLRRRHGPLVRRLAVNLLLSALAIGTALALVSPVVHASAVAAGRWRLGLLQWLSLPEPVAFVSGLFLLDATFYAWHAANHRLALLWRFHVVHHIDPDLDVSTAFRFHLGEVALSAVFRFLQIALIGPSLPTIVVYELLFQANTLFHHSNLRLPIAAERLLNRVLVTPRMHGIHHSMVRDENLSNFSVVFPWWDRLFRTLRLNVPQQAIRIGVPAYPAADNEPAFLLLLPFRVQRDPWRAPGGAVVSRNDRPEGESPTRLAG